MVSLTIPIFFLLLLQGISTVHLIKNEKEFKKMKETDNILVKFFAPWCGHCKALAPEYIKAAKTLKKKGIENVIMAEVDCTDSQTKKICEKYSVSGYPTLKYFSPQNKLPLDFSGSRSEHGLVSYIEKVIKEAISLIDSQKALDDLVNENEMVVVQYSTNNNNTKKFRQLANRLRLTYAFGKILDEELMKSHGANHEEIIIFRSFDDKKIHYKDSTKKLSDWIHHHSFPVLGELGGENYQKYLDRKMPIFWISVDKEDKKMMDEILKLTPTFKTHMNEILAVYIDGKKFKEALSNMGFKEKIPSAMIHDSTTEKKYRFNGDLVEKDVEEYIQKFKKNELIPFFKSEKPPKKNEGPIFEVVGDTFEEIVQDEEHDVILEYYLSYCKHCKNFAPEYEKLSKLFAEDKEIKFAKLNGEKNDTPFKVEGFPTVMMFRAGEKNKPLKYTGDMNAEAVETWIVHNSPLLKKSKKGEKKEKEGEKKEEKKEL